MTSLTISPEKCDKCGKCVNACAAHLITRDNSGDLPRGVAEIEASCIHCGHCVAVCPRNAIKLGYSTADEEELLFCGDNLEVATPFTPTMYQSFKQLVRSRRSVRNFHQEPVKKELLEELLDIARWAPSAKNQQPVRWLIINTPERVQKVAALVIDWMRGEEWAAGIVKVWDERRIDVPLRNAPCLVVAYAHDGSVWAMGDCAIALETLEYGATAAGLGSCWAGFFTRAARNHKPLADYLEIPEEHTIQGGLMLGRSKEKYEKVPGRNPVKVRWM